jgi:hypothetical protein
MSLTLYGMGTGAVAGLAGSTNESAVGYILGSSGLDLYKYKLDREITALNNPAAYLTAKKNAVDVLINPATIRNDIETETYRIGGTLGYPGAPAGDPGAANLYTPIAAPFVRDLAANQVLEKLKQDLALIDVQYPNSIDEVAKKKRKKIIKNKISTGEDL